MEQFHLPLFLVNTLLVLVDASLGYHFVPRLLDGLGNPEVTESGVRATRALLPAIVALYMFFNCLGYFQAETAYLLLVSGVVLVDLALQVFLRRKMGRSEAHDEDGGE